MGVGAMDWMPDCARTGIGGMAMWLAEVKAKAKRRNQILFTGDSLLLAELQGTGRQCQSEGADPLGIGAGRGDGL